MRPPDRSSPLSPAEVTRYSRHLSLPEVGEAGQRRLRASSVVIVGAGGLGSPVALYLAAAGVGTIGIVDSDAVDLTNLQRQVLYATRDVGREKADAATERVQDANPHVHVVPHRVHLTAQNALDVLRSYDLVIDGSDNFPTRYLVNDACVLLGKPNVHGSVLRFEGQATVFGYDDGPCYRCLYPRPPAPGTVPSCAEAGVLGVLPGLIGTIQATEALKILLGAGTTLVGRLLLVDALRMRFHTVSLARNPTCPACGTRELKHLIDYESWCGPSQAPFPPVRSIDPSALARWLRQPDAPFLLDVREPWEWGVAHIQGATLIPVGALDDLKGTLDPARDIVVYCHHGARSLASAQRLLDSGFPRIWNLTGGIAAWRTEVDPSLAAY